MADIVNLRDLARTGVNALRDYCLHKLILLGSENGPVRMATARRNCSPAPGARATDPRRQVLSRETRPHQEGQAPSNDRPDPVRRQLPATDPGDREGARRTAWSSSNRFSGRPTGSLTFSNPCHYGGVLLDGGGPRRGIAQAVYAARVSILIGSVVVFTQPASGMSGAGLPL